MKRATIFTFLLLFAFAVITAEAANQYTENSNQYFENSKVYIQYKSYGTYDIYDGKRILVKDVEIVFPHSKQGLGYKISKNFGGVNLYNVVTTTGLLLHDWAKDISSISGLTWMVKLNEEKGYGVITNYGTWIYNPDGKIVGIPAMNTGDSFDANNDKGLIVKIINDDGTSELAILDVLGMIHPLSSIPGGKWTGYRKFYKGVSFLYDESRKKYALVNYKGERPITLLFDDVLNFANNYAFVKWNGKWGAIDLAGRILMEPTLKKVKSTYYLTEGMYIDGVGYLDCHGLHKNYSPSEEKSWKQWSDEISRFSTSFDLPTPAPPSEDMIRQIIEAALEQWQKKDEYESTEQWQQRVNDATRKKQVDIIKQKIISDYNRRVEQYKLASQEHEAYIAMAYDNAFRKCAKHQSKHFASQDMQLMPYDSDNETFLIHTSENGDILLPVPLGEARKFAESWDNIKSSAKVEFVPDGDILAIKEVHFGKYSYCSDTEAHYSIALNSTSKFEPLDLSTISADNLSFEKVEAPLTSRIVSTRKPSVLESDVDINIPQSSRKAENSFALVIANQDYRNAVAVEGAANDGKTFARYMTETFGIPERQVFSYTNATLGDMIAAMKRIKNIAASLEDEDFDIIVYYAGHGVPDDSGDGAYLLPVDVDPVSADVGMSIGKLYADLASLGASQVTVFLDACFSGAIRGDGMLSHARGVVIRTNPGTPTGNLVAFTAASGKETAFPYSAKGHGLFTYFLLKKFQESKGDVTLGELAEFIVDKVTRESVVINNKQQTPSVVPSRELSTDWKSRRLYNIKDKR